MSRTKLLECPFCGGEAELIGHYIKGVANNYQYFVRCKTCKARPQSFRTFKKKECAIATWNTRIFANWNEKNTSIFSKSI